MGQLQSNIRLITRFPSVYALDSWMTISARPHDFVVTLNEQMTSDQIAIRELTSQIVLLQGAVKQLGKASLSSSKSVTTFNKQRFTDNTLGVVTKIDTPVELLAEDRTSLSAQCKTPLTDTIDTITHRCDFLNQCLDVEHQLLLKQFVPMESIMTQLQNVLCP